MYFNNIEIKMNKLFCGRANGFTLLEVIVALVVGAILGTMLVTFMSTGLTASVKTVARVENTYNLGSVIENITADYKKTVATSETPLETIRTSIGAAGSTFNNAYGSYKVINNGYITFACSGNNCSESNGGSSILKVTITDPDNTQTITALFSQ